MEYSTSWSEDFRLLTDGVFISEATKTAFPVHAARMESEYCHALAVIAKQENAPAIVQIPDTLQVRDSDIDCYLRMVYGEHVAFTDARLAFALWRLSDLFVDKKMADVVERGIEEILKADIVSLSPDQISSVDIGDVDYTYIMKLQENGMQVFLYGLSLRCTRKELCGLLDAYVRALMASSKVLLCNIFTDPRMSEVHCNAYLDILARKEGVLPIVYDKESPQIAEGVWTFDVGKLKIDGYGEIELQDGFYVETICDMDEDGTCLIQAYLGLSDSHMNANLNHKLDITFESFSNRIDYTPVQDTFTWWFFPKKEGEEIDVHYFLFFIQRVNTDTDTTFGIKVKLATTKFNNTM